MLYAKPPIHGWYETKPNEFSMRPPHPPQDNPNWRQQWARVESPHLSHLYQLRQFIPTSKNLQHTTGARAWLLIQTRPSRYHYHNHSTTIDGQIVNDSSLVAYTFGLKQLIQAVYRNTPQAGQAKLNLLQDFLATDWLHHYAYDHTITTIIEVLTALDI